MCFDAGLVNKPGFFCHKSALSGVFYLQQDYLRRRKVKNIAAFVFAIIVIGKYVIVV